MDTQPLTIPLSGGAVALVSPEDYERVSQFSWSVCRGRYTSYAYRNEWMNGRQRGIQMHRFIAGAGKGEEVDHKDRNGLNNTRENLRLCSKSQNHANILKRADAKHSTYKGVGRSQSGKFTALIECGDTRHHLGSFDTEEEAARVYDAAARHYFGEFARVNFPVETQPTLESLLAARDAARLAGKKSRFRGVVPDSRGPGWRAFIRKGGKPVYLGYFTQEEDAARAYDAAAFQHRGAKAKTNFPCPQEQP